MIPQRFETAPRDGRPTRRSEPLKRKLCDVVLYQFYFLYYPSYTGLLQRGTTHARRAEHSYRVRGHALSELSSGDNDDLEKAAWTVLAMLAHNVIALSKVLLKIT